jgi:hypothetical protein
MDAKFDEKFEHKYEDYKSDSITWFRSSNGTYDLQGRIPTRGRIVPINLIDEITRIQIPGNFHAEEKNGGINLIEVPDNGSGKIIYRWRPAPPEDSIDGLWNKQFESHENIKLLDEMIEEWADNEDYIEIDLNNKNDKNNKKSASGSNRNRSSGRRIIKKQKIRTVKDKFYVAKGPIQGCKSQYMMDGALKCLKLGKSSIIIFEETGHLIQFKERLQQEIDRITLNFRGARQSPLPLNYIIAKNGNFSVKDFLDAMQGKCPKIFLIIGNDKQAGVLNEKFEEASLKVRDDIMESYVLWIDEADHVDSETVAKKTISISALKKYSYAIIEVSATILDITGHADVKPSHLKLLHAPRSYRGIPSFKIELTEEKAKYAYKTDSNLLKIDKALKRIVREFVNNEAPVWCPTWNENHPCIMLVNNGKPIEPQKRVIMNLKRKYPDVVFIVYIGEGLYIHHPKLSGDSFKIKESKSVVTNYGHLFKGISPGSALLWLKQNGGVRDFHHILIFSGNLAGRSISYGCKDNSGVGMPYWHLTHHRLVLPPNSACPSVIQKCRLCTTFETNVPLKLYVSKKDEQAVIKSYWSQEEIIERSKNNPDETYLREIMSRLELMTKKIPSGRKLTIDKELKMCKRVNRDDGGLLLSSYKFDELPDRNREHISGKLEKDDVERKEIERKEESTIAEEISNLEKNVRTAADHNNDTIVLRILRYFKELDQDAIVNLSVLHQLGVSDIGHYTQWTRQGGSKGQYKLLIDHHSGYGLNPQIKHLLVLV